MHVWKLIGHHESAAQAYEQFILRKRVAVGWSEVGDLRTSSPHSATDIYSFIREALPHLSNARTGGPSLWNFYSQMAPGDLVIVSGKGKRYGVFELTGEYEYVSKAEAVSGYRHVRSAELMDLDPDLIWKQCGAKAAPGHAIRWTVARIETTEKVKRTVYEEGRRYWTIASAIERDPQARKACLEHYGSTCFVCGFDGEQVYGVEGRGLIHVHHRRELASREASYSTDPIKDLVPLCPNCHSMAHQKFEAYDTEQLRAMISLAAGKEVAQ